MKFRIRRSLLCTVVLLCGCTGLPSFVQQPPAATPPEYRNVASPVEGNLSRQWWLLYNDPVLTEMVQATLRDNPYTAIGLARIAQARAQLRATAADRMPALGLDVRGRNSHSSTTTPLGQLLGGRSISGNEVFGGLGAAWQIDLWDRVANAVEAASARADMARIVAYQIEMVLSMEVAVTYWQYRGADADLALLAQIRAFRAEALDLEQKRFETGLSDERDLQRAMVQLRRVDDQMIESEHKRTLAEQELATLLVKPLKGYAVPPDASWRMPGIPDIAPGLPSTILARRPDLAQSTQRIRELVAQEKIAETAFYPSITLTGSAGWSSEALSDLLKWDSRDFSLGPLALSLPIFDAGRNRANLETARALYLDAVESHKSALLIALREVDDALHEVQSARDHMRVRGETLQASQKLSELARSRYDVGQSNYVVVTRVEANTLELERKLTSSHVDGLLATVHLITALGGGWDPLSAEAIPDPVR